MVFIFIKNGSGGHTDTPPGVNAQFAQGHEWNKLVVLSPQRKARVVGEATAKTGAMAKDIVVPNITRGSGRTIRGSVPSGRTRRRRQRRCMGLSGRHAIERRLPGRQ